VETEENAHQAHGTKEYCYPAAVINIGSFPYGDPNYHAEGDIPETCDIENAAMTVQATLAAVVTIDRDFLRNYCCCDEANCRVYWAFWWIWS